ncbi:MAG: hypothetical protein M1838_003088 [Thelocarpon superellum]|nr:MAG: hypothetical protein M1838_003088 [Thelocarpon superellum]
MALVGALYRPLALRSSVLGVLRPQAGIENIHGGEVQRIPDTLYCEDLHYHSPSGLLFTAAEDDETNRWRWYPPLGHWEDPTALGRGSIVVIDPKTMATTRLALTGFSGPFIPHGIDLWSPPDEAGAVLIFAINHLPNPAYDGRGQTDVPRARSRVELFHHVLGTSEARHLRSIWHPLVRTPNDLYAVDAHHLYVTNDHYYREGLMRLVEDLGYQTVAPWTDLIHLHLTDLHATNDTAGVRATVANHGIHNNNGLGHGRDDGEVAIGRAAAGVIVLARRGPSPPLHVVESIQFESTVDNPSYFADPYVHETGRDASGFVVAGLARAIAFPDGSDPVVVWLVQRSEATNEWKKTLIFQDDGRMIRSASTAVLVPIPPKANQGRKQAWLFVTGPISKSIVVSKIDLGL